MDISKEKHKKLFIPTFFHLSLCHPLSRYAHFKAILKQLVPFRQLYRKILCLRFLVQAKLIIYQIKKSMIVSRNLSFTYSKAEILFKEWNLFNPSCKISKPIKLHVNLRNFYVKYTDSICCCTDLYSVSSKKLELPIQLQIGVYFELQAELKIVARTVQIEKDQKSVLTWLELTQ